MVLRWQPWHFMVAGALSIFLAIGCGFVPSGAPVLPSAAAQTPSATVPPSPVPAAAPPLPVVVELRGLPRRSWVRPWIDAAPNIVLAIIAAAATWIIGARLTAGWDLRKKRSELDLQLARDFNDLVVEFKAIGREHELLAQTRRREAANQQAVEGRRQELIKRAVAAESRLEAILLKLASETAGWLAAYVKEPADRRPEEERQLRMMGLLRVVFRNLRESIVEERDADLDYLDAERWLFNRLSADLVGIIHQRATTPALPPLLQPWKIVSVSPRPDAAAYLRLLDFRTIDLRTALAQLEPKLRDYNRIRDEVRRSARQVNVNRVFDSARTEFRCAGAPEAIGPNIEMIVEPTGTRQPDRAVLPRAEAVFRGAQGLSRYMALADGPPRVLLVSRDLRVQRFEELDRLPRDLPYSTRAGPQAPLGIALLGWSPSQGMQKALGRVATVPLSQPP